ncbi:MAG TPA: heavy metal-associated domain-containing protein [Pseudogracilibacillus sp.]|nr:heavy metal-associated domain-containing protein [Pseudogracilibacillus sp.]
MSEKITYVHIEGMHCTNRMRRIERAMIKMSGINNVKVNITTNKGRITFNQSKTSKRALLK